MEKKMSLTGVLFRDWDEAKLYCSRANATNQNFVVKELVFSMGTLYLVMNRMDSQKVNEFINKTNENGSS